MVDVSVQQRHAPQGICFGCGPANTQGLRIQSFRDPDAPAILVASWTPQPHHQAFPGVLNGGIIGTLLDCHCNWTAAMYMMDQRGAESPPCTVTADYGIELKKPTPADRPVQLRAWVVEATTDKAKVEGTLQTNGQICARCRGTFVAVRPGHPAYHRW